MGRVNKAIAKLEKGEPVFYTGGHAGMELTYEAGVGMADTWADYINVGMEHGPLDVAGLTQFMKGMASVRTPRFPCLPNFRSKDAAPRSCSSTPGRSAQLLTTGIHGFLLCTRRRRTPWPRWSMRCATPSAAEPAVRVAKARRRRSGG